MEPAESDRHVTALREEIRQAGFDTGRLRRLLTAGGCMGLLLAVGLAAAAFAWIPDYGPIIVAVYMTFAIGPAALLAYAIACCVAKRYREGHRERLRRIVAPMSWEQRQLLLAPLADRNEGDARRIVEPLLREFDLAAEVAPAPAPDARGDEASPAGEA